MLAARVRLLDLGFFRIGSEEYAETNHTYGLATHPQGARQVGRDGMLTFDYTAKHGKQRVQTVADDEVCDVVAALKRRRGGGDELLAYRAVGGAWADVRSPEINDYLRQLFGMECSAKDFRTWHATVLAAVGPRGVPAGKHLAVHPQARGSPYGQRGLRRISATRRRCAGASYIDPRVIDLYDDGFTIADDLEALGRDTQMGSLATHGPVEQAVLRLLSRRRTSRTAAHKQSDLSAARPADTTSATAPHLERYGAVAGSRRAGGSAAAGAVSCVPVGDAGRDVRRGVPLLLQRAVAGLDVDRVPLRLGSLPTGAVPVRPRPRHRAGCWLSWIDVAR